MTKKTRVLYVKDFPISVEQMARAENPQTVDFRRATAAAAVIYVDPDLPESARRSLKHQLLVEGMKFEDSEERGEPIGVQGLVRRLLTAVAETDEGRQYLVEVLGEA